MATKRKMKLLLVLLSASAAVAVRECRGKEFLCDGTRCLPANWLCDGDPDCADGTDEQPRNCPGDGSQGLGRECTDTEFKCGNGNCIPKTWLCDGQDDCRDNTDEQHQDCGSCAPGEFQCVSNQQCISGAWRCNGMEDCTDGSDEASCPSGHVTVPPHMFRCRNGITIPRRWVCDGQDDCTDGSDELDCEEEVTTATPAPLCRDNEYQCGSYCIMQAWVCDGGVDCPNGEDEVDCGQQCSASQFQCANNQCVLGHMRCNGDLDCQDGSDEDGCATPPPSPTPGRDSCNLTTHFLCDQNKCISNSSLCNGRNDCGDWQDESEEVCGVNECEEDNGGCTQGCVDTREGYYCSCHNGYQLVGKYTCEDIDECEEVPGICSQKCTNTLGSYHCSCLPGYQRDPRNFTRCKASSGEPYLLFSHRYDIRSLRIRDSDMTSVVTDARGATGLDFLFSSKQIIWSDNKENKIMRANMTNPEAREVLVAGDQVSADGLAVDWIHGNLYYTDTIKFQIHLVSWDARWSRAIVKEDLGQPRAIVVSPLDGYIFWSDWGSSPKIERAGLDGSDRRAIVSAPHVYWPNGITIDHAKKDLYWCDGKLSTISKAKLDGSEVEVILFSKNVLRLPYSITVFEDRLYWTDWSQTALYSVDKFTGDNIQSVSAGHMLESPKVVHVYHRFRQPEGENVCSGHSCSHMCVRDAEGRPRCVCPDSMILSLTDVLTCRHGVEEVQSPGVQVEDIGEVEKVDVEEVAAAVTESSVAVPVVSATPKPPIQISMILGATAGCTVLLAVAVVLFVGWQRMRRGAIIHSRFPNPVYRKTTDPDEEDGCGYILGQDQLIYNPPDYQYPEHPEDPVLVDDDVPLAPKKK